MEPLFILVPGVLGGLVIALLMATSQPRTPDIFVPRPLAAPSPGLINMASIRVEGIGGLGMVAAVVTVAVADPRIRLAIVLAAVLGTALALVLIASRRRTGALPSGGDGPADRSLLCLDCDEPHPAPGRGAIERLVRLERARTLPAQLATQTVFTLTNSRIPCTPSSRP